MYWNHSRQADISVVGVLSPLREKTDDREPMSSGSQFSHHGLEDVEMASAGVREHGEDVGREDEAQKTTKKDEREHDCD